MRITAVAAGLFLATMTTATQAALLDFETGLSEGDPISTQFEASHGVTFSSTDSIRAVKVGGKTTGFVPHDKPKPGDAFGKYFLGTAFDDGLTDLKITYTNPVAALSFQIADIDGPEHFVFKAFDAASNLLQMKEVTAGDPGTGNRLVYDVFFADLGGLIKTVEIFGDSQGKNKRKLGIAFDNFNTTAAPAAVPVPAALPLLAAGLGALGLARRRKAKQA